MIRISPVGAGAGGAVSSIGGGASPVPRRDPAAVPGCLVINKEAGLAPYDHSGNAYAPYQYPGSTAVDNGDGTVTVFMNLSGYNPYVTWQMSARFIKHPSVRVTPGVKLAGSIRIPN